MTTVEYLREIAKQLKIANELKALELRYSQSPMIATAEIDDIMKEA